MPVSEFAPILIQAVLAVSLAVVILVASHLLGQRSATNKIKDSAYECGIPVPSGGRWRFPVKFYLVALLFVLFDIEVVFLVPWAIVYREFLASGAAVLAPGLFFAGVLALGLVYEVRKGALNWER
jgi:NADH-quinone oxidoreductase subunit A